MSDCQKNFNSQQIWLRQNGTIRHKNSGKCLETKINVTTSLWLTDCKRGNGNQLWRFSIPN